MLVSPSAALRSIYSILHIAPKLVKALNVIGGKIVLKPTHPVSLRDTQESASDATHFQTYVLRTTNSCRAALGRNPRPDGTENLAPLLGYDATALHW